MTLFQKARKLAAKLYINNLITAEEWGVLIDGIPDDTLSPVGDSKTFSPLRNHMRVETPLGAIIVKEDADPDYPGIWIDLRRPDAGEDATLAHIEYVGDENSFVKGERHIVTLVWKNVMTEADSISVVHEGIEEFFAVEEVTDDLDGDVGNDEAAMKKLLEMKKLCACCESRDCQFYHGGECRFALVHEREPRINDEQGCLEYEYREN